MKVYETELQRQLVQRINHIVSIKRFPKEKMAQFANYYDIPYRTLLRCCTGHTYPSVYLVVMLEKLRYIEFLPEQVLSSYDQKLVKENPYIKKQLPETLEEQAAYIKYLRKSLCPTQSEFCKVFHIPARTIQTWESGRVRPGKYIIRLLDMALHYKDLYFKIPDDFLTYSHG